jgi:hypothetical protein
MREQSICGRWVLSVVERHGMHIGNVEKETEINLKYQSLSKERACLIFGGDGVAAAICLCGLLSVGQRLLSVGRLVGDAEAFGNSRSVGWSVGDARCTVAFWLLLLYPTVKCLGLGHSEHCGYLHGFSPYFPPLRGGVIWCIF